ncbi:MAG: hypothetical protein GC147_11010 [Porphyrobacter sp.]|nr:hypothetical protein [Porphyrobacter sp.]
MTKPPLRLAALALAAATLAGCATIPDAPIVEGTPLPPGSAVALLQPVAVGKVVVTPREVVEDSRCPVNARCTWAGRLVVKTRIDGAGWRDTADLTLGEPFGTHDVVIALTSGEPAPETGREVAPEDYRFTYETR